MRLTLAAVLLSLATIAVAQPYPPPDDRVDGRPPSYDEPDDRPPPPRDHPYGRPPPPPYDDRDDRRPPPPPPDYDEMIGAYRPQ
jgi:hypothetical protein